MIVTKNLFIVKKDSVDTLHRDFFFLELKLILNNWRMKKFFFAISYRQFLFSSSIFWKKWKWNKRKDQVNNTFLFSDVKIRFTVYGKDLCVYIFSGHGKQVFAMKNWRQRIYSSLIICDSISVDTQPYRQNKF